METRIFKIDPENIDISLVEEAADILSKGGLLAFPTETVYGLGADGLNEDASGKIYSAKGRPSDNPLIIHIGKREDLNVLAKEISKNAEILMDNFWPGPLTIVFKKKEEVPYSTTGGLDTVGVRMPSHPIALELIKRSGVCVAAPSANTSGRPSPTKAKHVIEDMMGKIDGIVDGGDVGIGIESTIVDMSGDVPVILRPGAITKEMMEELIGEVQVDRVVDAKSKEELGKGDYVPKAPGMKYRHYAPKAQLIMYEGEIESVIKKIKSNIINDKKAGKVSGIICTDETMENYKATEGVIISIGTRDDESTIAHNLYGVLREFDDTDVSVIYCETFYYNGLGHAIMNRLIKAAGYKVEKV